MYNNNRREHHGAQFYKIQIFYTQLLIITFYNTTNNNINYSIISITTKCFTKIVFSLFQRKRLETIELEYLRECEREPSSFARVQTRFRKPAVREYTGWLR